MRRYEGYERSRRFECTLFATAVKSFRSRWRGFAKLKHFIQIECTTRTKGRESRSQEEEFASYPQYFSSCHYGHNHLSVPPRQSSLFIDEASKTNWDKRKNWRETVNYNFSGSLSIIFRIKRFRGTSILMHIRVWSARLFITGKFSSLRKLFKKYYLL